MADHMQPDLKRRMRRTLRLRRRRMVRAGEEAQGMVDKHFFHRLGRMGGIRRFLLSWLGLIIILTACVAWQTLTINQYYLDLRPASGGTYREGVLGSFTNANPLFATSLADTSVSGLVFSGMLRYDNSNKLITNLAKKLVS